MVNYTVTSLIEATDKWSINIDNKLLNGVIFKKAFDSIDQKIKQIPKIDILYS